MTNLLERAYNTNRTIGKMIDLLKRAHDTNRPTKKITDPSKRVYDTNRSIREGIQHKQSQQKEKQTYQGRHTT